MSTTPSADTDANSKGDFLSDRSEDAELVTAWLAPGHSATFVLTPEAQRLADTIQPLGAAVVELRDLVRAARNQISEIEKIWCMLRGLAAIAAMHFVYNQMCGGQPDGWSETAQRLSDQSNALLDKCSKSPAFLMTDGDKCKVSILPLNGIIRRQLYKLVVDIDGHLKDSDLRQAYDDLAKTSYCNANVQSELYIANIIIAEAHELVALAGPLMAPSHSARKIVDDMGSMLDALMAKPADEARKNPGTDTVLDVALPSWARSGLANAANAAGAATPGFGPDHLFLKLIILYLHRQVPKAVGDPTMATRLRNVIIPALHEALGIDDAAAGGEFEKLLKAGEPLHAARANLATAKGGGVGPTDLESLETAERAASRDMDEAMRKLKEEYLGEKLHLHDGPVANGVLTALAAIQIVDALLALSEAQKAREKTKSAADIAGGLGSLASTLPAIVVRVSCVDGTAAWLEGSSSFALRNIGKFVTPTASVVSGVMQVWSGYDSGKTSDEVIGGLNIIYGGSFLIYAALPTVVVWPVIGQTAAFLAFATGLIVGLIEEGTLMTERYFKSAVDALQKTNWAHGDPPTQNNSGDQGTIAHVLGFQSELDAFAATVKTLAFWPIPVVPGTTKTSIVSGLSYYTGSKSISERMVAE